MTRYDHDYEPVLRLLNITALDAREPISDLLFIFTIAEQHAYPYRLRYQVKFYVPPRPWLIRGLSATPAILLPLSTFVPTRCIYDWLKKKKEKEKEEEKEKNVLNKRRIRLEETG